MRSTSPATLTSTPTLPAVASPAPLAVVGSIPPLDCELIAASIVDYADGLTGVSDIVAATMASTEIEHLPDDQIVVEGPLGQTNKGETTIWGTSLAMASKALLPPPAKWEGLSDVELRYRQRYVDLWANPEVMKLANVQIGEHRKRSR